ncbi:UNKNOWN [Stylonychia lemnae]|uniref:Transmembrane protein n=1 Tax=Stylonychia lemnae TaxID=5949 RepID=A0A078B914_STYLE|nr:UNKNOWN [Stylonychia lemnae]|eukprot:CDW90874.1 UNKNOWN [Stylonychia lemnae]
MRVYLQVLILISIKFALCQHLGQNRTLLLNGNLNMYQNQMSTKDQQIIQIQNFSNYLIELYETQEFELQQYFSGPLLDYDYEITDINGTWYFDQPFYKILIQLTPPFENVASIPIKSNQQTQSSQNDPMQGSSILVPELNGTTLTLYMIDRNLSIYKYDVSDYGSGVMTGKKMITLNSSYINDGCHDLTYLQFPVNNVDQKALLIFCRSEIYDTSGDVDYYLYTNVYVDINNDSAAEAYYNQFRQTAVFVDFVAGIKFIGFEHTQDKSISAIFLSNMRRDFFNPYYLQVIARVNISEFLVMQKNKSQQQYNLQGTMGIKFWIKYDTMYQQDTVINFGIISYQPMMIGIIFDNYGVLVCQFTEQLFEPEVVSFFYAQIDCHSQNTSQLIEMDNALSLYNNPQDSDFFFITMSSPPGVVEINIDDPYNIYIFKQYSLPNESPAYIGLKTMTFNKNVIVHLMYNVEADQQVLRLYNRNASHYSIAKYNYVLPQKSRTNYFYFPNFYQNNLIFRDERRLNITTFFDFKLTLNATNYTWVNTFKQNIFQVNLTISNPYQSINSLFNVTFVEADFTSVIRSGDQSEDQSVFYNCGDDSFSYRVSDLFNGPNFNVSFETNNTDDCEAGYCFFDIINQEIKQTFEADFTNLSCWKSFIFPDLQDYDDESDPVILICIDNENQIITASKLVMSTNTLVLLNSITMPSLFILYANSDTASRTLFVIAQIVDQEWVDSDNEVHFFSIQSELVWESSYRGAINLQNYNLSDLQIYKFNSHVNSGIILGQMPDQLEQILIYFQVNYTETTFDIIANATVKVDQLTQVSQVALSSDGFIFALQANSILNIYQVVQLNNEYVFQRLKSKPLDDEVYKPHEMDIHGNYFIIYYGINQVLVYDIKNFIDLQYRTKLPLYGEYQNFRFSYFAEKSPRQGQVIHSAYYQDFIALLLMDPDYHGQQKIMIFIYSLFDYQHNSLIMIQDFTELFEGSSNRTVVLTGNDQHTSMVLITDAQISLSNVQLFNFIIIKDDVLTKTNLFDQCSWHKSYVDDQGIERDKPFQLAMIKIKAQSLFPNGQTQDYGNVINLKIQTQNQGIAITTHESHSKEIFFSYGSQQQENQQDLMLMVDNLLEGFNISYHVNCQFFDRNNNVQDCVDDGIVDNTQSTIYNFYIEQVTQDRQIVKSFTLGNVFIMFDTLNMITIQVLQTTDGSDLDSINGQALKSQMEYTMIDKLGCNIEGYINIYECFFPEDWVAPDYSLYLAIYECKIENTLNIKLAQIRIYNQTKFTIQVLDGSNKIPYRVIDIDRSNVTFDPNTPTKVGVTIGISLEVPASTSNIFYVCNLTADIELNLVTFNDLKVLSAMFEDRNVFKIQQLMSIPNSDLMILVDQLFGFYIYDLDSLQIIKEFDLRQIEYFPDQPFGQDLLYNLQVFTVAGNWPNEIHILTSQGIFIFNFKVDLCQRGEIFPFFSKTLEPISKRIIRQTFDQFNNEIAHNQYGYSFLTTTQAYKSSYDVYLTIVSFFASSRSKLFRSIKVTQNQNCISLNEESYLVEQEKDELVVSFICNTQLFIVRTVLKPSFQINMKQYSSQATRIKKGKNQGGALQFNQFNLTISGYNEYNQTGMAQSSIKLILYQKTYPDQDYPQFYLICLFIFCTAIALIMLLTMRGNKQQDKKVAFDEQNIPKMSFAENRGSTQANHSSFIPSHGDSQKLLNLQSIRTSNIAVTTTHFQNTEVGAIDSHKALNKLAHNSNSNTPELQKKDSKRFSKNPQFEMLSSEVMPQTSLIKLSTSFKQKAK